MKQEDRPILVRLGRSEPASVLNAVRSESTVLDDFLPFQAAMAAGNAVTSLVLFTDTKQTRVDAETTDDE